MDDLSELPESKDPDREGIIRLEDDGKKRIWDDPANVKRLLKIFFLLCGIFFILDLIFFFTHKHSVFAFEGWFGFVSVCGCMSCSFSVIIGKELRKVLMRSEDYYDKCFAAGNYYFCGGSTGRGSNRQIKVSSCRPHSFNWPH